MIIVSSRKFRDSQNEYFELAKKEEVILKTLHYGNFRLVPIKEPKINTEKKKGSGRRSKASIHIPDELLRNIASEAQINPTPEPIEEVNTLNNDTVTSEEIQSPTLAVESTEEVETVFEVPVETIETVSKVEEVEEIVEVPITTEETPEITPIVEEPINTIEETPEVVIEEEKHEIIEDPKPETKIPEEKIEVDYITAKLNLTSNKEAKKQEIETDNSLQNNAPTPSVEEPSVKEEWKPGNVFVDPSLLTLEEVRIQEGLEDMNKKESFFSKIFKKKK